ncbi:hypothetical protein B0T20DRAFT_396333 [Sordaria brevicollis]|uniref:Uncharacterized protein n=1 Tax=Sordaria brevicollis TaxID=83679 RepID=A0AAE0P1Q3_SORBR|nr:hypothetical protein B0T20DRAFT_396333 [Sordaria brevicollis]
MLPSPENIWCLCVHKTLRIPAVPKLKRLCSLGGRGIYIIFFIIIDIKVIEFFIVKPDLYFDKIYTFLADKYDVYVSKETFLADSSAVNEVYFSDFKYIIIGRRVRSISGGGEDNGRIASTVINRIIIEFIIIIGKEAIYYI